MIPRDRATVILVVDVWLGMEARDVKPTRLVAATAARAHVSQQAPERLRVGLIAFAGDPAVAARPTTDHGLVREALDTIQWFPGFGGKRSATRSLPPWSSGSSPSRMRMRTAISRR